MLISDGGIYKVSGDITKIERKHNLIGQFGEFIHLTCNESMDESEEGNYWNFLGEEYMEKDGAYNEPGTNKYYFFSYRDKECPIEGTPSRPAPGADTVDADRGKDRIDTHGTGSFEAYFCSEEMDTVLNKPSCEMFVNKNGNKAIIHIYEYRDGVVKYESISTGVYDEIFTPEQVSEFEADNLASVVGETGEYVLIMIDKDSLVINGDYGTVILDYFLSRAEHR